MPQLNLPPYEKFYGLNTVENAEDVKDSEASDSRNNDISEPKVLKTRAGMSRVSTTALSAAAWEIFSFVGEEETQIRLALTNDGKLQTW